MRKQLLIASLALAVTAYGAAAQSKRSEPASNEPAEKSDTSEPLKNDQATDDAKPAPAKKARKRESSEHKARRIAKKYGITW
jgi:hypothetical protein